LEPKGCEILGLHPLLTNGCFQGERARRIVDLQKITYGTYHSQIGLSSHLSQTFFCITD